MEEIKEPAREKEGSNQNYSNKVKIIKATDNKEILVDIDDFEWLNQYRWSGVHYPSRYVPKYKTESMHRMIMGNPKGMQIDHINGNGFDNRRVNLRICSLSQNLFNQKKYKGQSIYKGLTKTKNGYWIVHIQVNKIRTYIGRFKNQRYAAMAYDIWAKDIYGEFAKLNFEGALHGRSN